MRGQKYLVLPEEDGAEFAALEAALIEELAPVGALQVVLARPVAVAAWRLARADRIEVELFEERGYDAAGPGLALVRDGNGTRSFETLLRYRGAAMAEFWRARRTLKTLQVEQAVATGPGLEAHPERLAPRPAVAPRRPPNEPKRGAQPAGIRSAHPPVPGRTLHEPAAPRMPNEPEHRGPARLPDQPPTAPDAPWTSNDPEHRGPDDLPDQQATAPDAPRTSNEPEHRRPAELPDQQATAPDAPRTSNEPEHRRPAELPDQQPTAPDAPRTSNEPEHRRPAGRTPGSTGNGARRAADVELMPSTAGRPNSRIEREGNDPLHLAPGERTPRSPRVAWTV